MSIKGTAIKLALVSIILALCSALLVVVFGQLRFQRFHTYDAEFSNGSGLKAGQFVRAGGVYGDFFNFYLCDITLTLNGLQPGGPVRKVRITKQPTGRCTPQ